MNQLPVPPALLPDLEQVEDIITQRLKARPIVFQVVGKNMFGEDQTHIRAALTLLTAQLGRYNLEDVIHSAAAVELIQVALLTHSSSIDETARRRGDQALQDAWQGDASLMIGDYLLALAASEMAQAPDRRIIAYFSRSVMAISESELAPVMDVAPREVASAQYVEKIGGKTAALFEAACKAGMVCGKGTQEQAEAAGQFGYHFGLAYQIMCDLRDYLDEGAQDLRRGVITLPLIYVAALLGDPQIAVTLDLQQPNDEWITKVINQVRDSGAAEQVRTEARKYVEQAIAQLDLFPDSPAKAALTELAHAVVEQ